MSAMILKNEHVSEKILSQKQAILCKMAKEESPSNRVSYRTKSGISFDLEWANKQLEKIYNRTDRHVQTHNQPQHKMIDRDDPNYGDELYVNSSLLSVCCGAPQAGDSDICSDCGEHTSFEKDTEDERKR
jgi:hypothetical protein